MTRRGNVSMVELATMRVAPQWSAGEWLRTLPPAAPLILQGGDDARAAAGQAFAVPLSDEPCRARTNGERAALWLGPDEHLLIGAASESASLAGQLAAALPRRPHSILDVS